MRYNSSHNVGRGAGLYTSGYVLPDDYKRESLAFITHRSGGNTSSSGQGQRSKQKSMSNATCYYCGKPGHFVGVCKKHLADQQQGNTGNGGGNLQRKAPIKMGYAVGSESRSDTWHLDSASVWHITYDVSKLEDMRAVQPEKMCTVVGYDGSRHQPTDVDRYIM
ncbi:hypothetical protein VaNZ11_006649 [Volvox africanus]|uniref:CCHC-type domain-containing protein n=1 Tax=Volvox africanus TaxID=51714 RepID=A0ABQ5S1M8_9CHLO|nr:hypothetical protein VaNZ11_006649 [Volvox africanus]